MSEFILTVIIPTRNRQYYAFQSVKQIVESTSERVQVVIQDNSDGDSLKSEILKLSQFESRIKYSYTNETLSFVDNFSKGVDLADGVFICMIGDDDGINSDSEILIDWAIRENIKAINPKVKVNYFWPNTNVSTFKSDNGNFLIYPFTGKIEKFKTEPELKKLLNSGGQNYLDYNMVKVYHGFVKKSEFDKVKKKIGKYFGGLSPDIHSAVALSIVIDEVVVIDYPFTIPGVCSSSGSGHSATGRHHGELHTAPQLKGHFNYKWTDLIPKFYSVETLWADSAIAAFVDMDRSELLKNFNTYALASLTYFKYKEFKKPIIKFLFKNPNNIQYSKFGNLISFASNIFNFPIKNLLKRIKNKLFKENLPIIIENVTSIIDAEKKLKNFLKDKKTLINKLQ